MTVDEAKKAAHGQTAYEWAPGLCGSECPICLLATVAYNAGKTDGFNENVAACAEKVKALEEQIESMRRADAAISEALNSGDGVYRP